MRRPKPIATCATSGAPIYNEEDHLKICCGCRSAKYFWLEILSVIFFALVIGILLIGVSYII